MDTFIGAGGRTWKATPIPPPLVFTTTNRQQWRVECKSGGWNDAQHPRDSKGRFIETGARVRLWTGGHGTVVRNVGGGKLEVADDNGNHRIIDRHYLTVEARPGGGVPTAKRSDAPAPAPVKPPTSAAKPDPPTGKPPVPPASTHPPGSPLPPAPAPAPTLPVKDPFGEGELTPAQQIVRNRAWRNIPTGNLAQLQADLAGIQVADVPSVAALIDQGMSPDDATAAYKAAYTKARRAAWKQRILHQAAIDTILAKDAQKDAPSSKAASELDPTPDGVDTPATLDTLADVSAKPGALYDRPQNLPPEKGPGAVDPAGMAWFDVANGLSEADDPVPVLGLTVQGHKVEQGWVVKRNGRLYLVEQRPDETPEQAMARLDAYVSNVEGVVSTVPAGHQHHLRGAALLNVPNPSDGHWAAKYDLPGFTSAATGGDGSITAWNGANPKPTTIAHEFGHNLDAALLLNSTWLSESDQPVLPGQGLSWGQASEVDKTVSGSFEGRFKETRLHPFVKPIQVGDYSVTDYAGAGGAREDFAESVRLWLKDRREGKIGYDPTTGDNLRFSDVFPERARILDTAFGIQDPNYDTPSRKRRMKQAEDDFLATAVALPESTPITPDMYHPTAEDVGKYGLRPDDILAARMRALDKVAEQRKAAVEAAKAAAAAKAALADLDAKKAANAQALIDSGKLDKSITDQFRAKRNTRYKALLKKGLSESEAATQADAYERTLLRRWIADNPDKTALVPWKAGTMAPKMSTAEKQAAHDWLLKAGGVPHPLAGTEYGKAQQAKANIAAELASRLNNPEDWEAFRQYQLSRKLGDVGPYESVSQAARQELLHQEVSARVQQWAVSSGDSSHEAVQMQQAIAEEFGLAAHPAPAIAPEKYAVIMHSYTAERAAFYRAMLRHQYAHTQEELAKAGVKKVSVYRGMKFMYGDTPPWAKDGEHTPQLQPANSWSTNLTTSKKFGTTIFKGSVDATLVLGTARTGFGCLNEQEFVILYSDDGIVQVVA